MIGHSQECYLVITPDKKVYEVKGDWPEEFITNLCIKYEEVVVVSLYSNTVKFVRNDKEYEEVIAKTYKEVLFAKEITELKPL